MALRDQRDPVPFNRRAPRLKDSSGGAVALGVRRTIAPGMEDDQTRYCPTTFDDQIRRDKTPWFPIPHWTPAGQGWVNWTQAGPIRPTLHMRTVNQRTMAGTSRTRFLANPLDPSVGLHTNPAVAVTRTVPRYVTPGVPQIRHGRQDRLTSGQYSGQSYSQTTRMQGGAR